MTRPAKTALALGKIDLEEKTTDLRLKLKGKLAVDLADYQRAFAQANEQSLELEQLVPHILAAFIDADKGFQAWRKAHPGLGVSVKEEYFAAECAKAQQLPGYENTFKRLLLNIWTEQNTRWLPMETWDRCADSTRRAYLAP